MRVPRFILNSYMKRSQEHIKTPEGKIENTHGYELIRMRISVLYSIKCNLMNHCFHHKSVKRHYKINTHIYSHRLPIVSNSAILQSSFFRRTGSRSGNRRFRSGRLTAPYLFHKQTVISVIDTRAIKVFKSLPLLNICTRQ